MARVSADSVLFEDVCEKLGGEVESEAGEDICIVEDEDSFVAMSALIQNLDALGLNAGYRYEDGHERVEVDFGKEGSKFEMRGKKVGYEPLVDEGFHDWLVDEAVDDWGLSREQAERFAESREAEGLADDGYEAVEASHRKRPADAKPYVWDELTCGVESPEAVWSTFPMCEASVEQERMVISAVFNDLTGALDVGVDRASSAFHDAVRERGERIAKKFKK